MNESHDYSEIEQVRLQKLAALRQQGVEAFPRHVERSHTTAEAMAAFEAAEKEKCGSFAESTLSEVEGSRLEWADE